MTLAEFYAARLAEVEAVAKAASPGPWHLNTEGDEVLAVDGVTVADAFALSGGQQRATFAHIALHDPDRALREVAADRKLLDMYEEQFGRDLPEGVHDGRDPDERERDEALRAMLGDIIAVRAAVFDGHPDYEPAWRPE